MAILEVDGKRIEYEYIGTAGPEQPTLVFLHEGLGSLALWKDFPRQVAAATACNALVYSRIGYGQSSPLTGPRDLAFMHHEALTVLPLILEALEIDDPILFGHSDGASIALIHAGSAGRPVQGVVVMAPHVMVEPLSIRSIAAVKRSYETTDLREKLRRYHADPEGAFRGWCDIWLDARFIDWNIEEHVRNIHCPILAIQGLDDEYGTMAQIDRIDRLVPNTELLKLSACGHSPHRDQPHAVIAAARRHVEIVKHTHARR